MSGEEVGTGHDGEPLIRNVKMVKELSCEDIYSPDDNFGIPGNEDEDCDSKSWRNVYGMDEGVAAVLYIGIALDKRSREMLLEYIPPVHENVTANHVTLVHEPSDNELALFAEGEPMPIRVVGYAEDDRSQVVAVQLPKHFMGLARRTPHITISTAPGVQQVYSNELIEAGLERPPMSLVLRGTVLFVGI